MQKLQIVCQEHGIFLQTAPHHVRGLGCPSCGKIKSIRSRIESQNTGGWSRSQWIAKQNNRKATLYIIKAENRNESFYKVGITFNSIGKRFTKTSFPYQFRTVALYKSYDAGEVYDLENKLHQHLKHISYNPLLSFGGQTECFTDISPIISLLPTETFFLSWAKMALSLGHLLAA
ncbi:GIY-YIG nuclease family protein [Hymenobacter rigui]|uniref:GIY-YIG nuclease family protein n=1 Tax=Hymenobacter rigui TaxID=334424 RepID=UPI0014775738|nr:GIY-YIG nuclease family protein [Hymenobacter rigui]